MYLRLNRIIYPVYNLGPGARIALWMQGCKIHCKGCINPELHDCKAGRQVEVASLVLAFSKIITPFDGITITGGEPFDQYEALIAFCAFAKKITGIHIFVYSGYTLTQLFQKFPDRTFLKYIDLLKAGPYINNLNENEYFRGSTNQQLYSFESDKSGKIKFSVKPFSETVNKWSAGIDENHNIFLTGIPGKNDMKILTEKLNCTGINSNF
jgi:anaerobic ribonucleoside-triphosphate reductase activating protein